MKTYRTNVQIDTPTPNSGKIFSRDKLEGAIQEYLSSDNHMGMLEELGDDGFELNYERISHNVKNVFIDDDGFMCVDVEFLDTEFGKIASFTPDMLELRCALIGFCGWEGDSNIVEEAGIVNFNIGWKVEEIELAA